MTNGGVAPRSSVSLRIHATATAITTPIAYMANMVSPCKPNHPPRYLRSGMKAPTNNV